MTTIGALTASASRPRSSGPVAPLGGEFGALLADLTAAAPSRPDQPAEHGTVSGGATSGGPYTPAAPDAVPAELPSTGTTAPLLLGLAPVAEASALAATAGAPAAGASVAGAPVALGTPTGAVSAAVAPDARPTTVAGAAPGGAPSDGRLAAGRPTAAAAGTPAEPVPATGPTAPDPAPVPAAAGTATSGSLAGNTSTSATAGAAASLAGPATPVPTTSATETTTTSTDASTSQEYLAVPAATGRPLVPAGATADPRSGATPSHDAAVVGAPAPASDADAATPGARHSAPSAEAAAPAAPAQLTTVAQDGSGTQDETAAAVAPSPLPSGQAPGGEHTVAPTPTPSTATPAAPVPPGPTPAAPAAPPAAPPSAQVFSVLAPVLEGPDGTYTLALQLHPEELGPVQVDVLLRGGEIRLALHAGDDAAQQVLRAALPDLRAELHSAGLQATQLSVDGGRSEQQPPPQQDRLPRSYGRQARPDDGSRTVPSPVPAPTSLGDAALDLRM